MTDAEVRLWFHLRRGQQLGFRFRKQHPIGRYIADFACIEQRVIVEVDGGQHDAVVDSARDAWFRRHAYRVLRFWNDDVLLRTDLVLADILRALNA